MRAVAPIVMLICVAGGAVAQESAVRSVTPDRLGTWAPRDANACDSIYGDGRQLCLADRYRMHREQQGQDDEAALQRAQTEHLRLQNELLRRELVRVQAAAVAPSAAELAAMPGFSSWQSENRWFGPDHARTEFALLYAKDLRQAQPELGGRPFLSALSTRVREVFASKR